MNKPEIQNNKFSDLINEIISNQDTNSCSKHTISILKLVIALHHRAQLNEKILFHLQSISNLNSIKKHLRATTQ